MSACVYNRACSAREGVPGGLCGASQSGFFSCQLLNERFGLGVPPGSCLSQRSMTVHNVTASCVLLASV